jgi:HK97 family phage major capsid protein
MESYKTLTAQYAEKHKQLADFFSAHKSEDLTMEQVEQVRSWNTELNDLGEKRDKARDLESIQEKTAEVGRDLAKPHGRPFTGSDSKGEVKVRSLSDAFVGAIYKDGALSTREEREVKDFGFAEFKTTMTSSGGFPAEQRRSGRLELSLQAPITVTDFLPTIPITQGSSYTYMKETTFTNNTAGIAEAATYPESALAFTATTLTVTKVGTWIPVTEEQLSDVDGMRALIDNRLQLMVKLEVERQILQTDGTSNTINGFYNQVTQTQALGSDPIFDAILKGANKVRTVGMAEPDAVIMHPDQYIYVRLARTVDGVYIMGNPDQVGVDRLFGIRTIQSLKATSGTALVGDFGTHSALITKWGLDVQATNSHDVNFIKDIWAIKARMRLNLAVFRPEAFCEVTGLPS